MTEKIQINMRFILDIEDLKEAAPNATISEAHKIETLERQLKDKDALIEQLLDQINEMKCNFHDWIERAENGGGCDENTSKEDSTVESETHKQTHVATIPIQEDESYFMSYAHYAIHYDMLSVGVKFRQNVVMLIIKFAFIQSNYRTAFEQMVIVKLF